jgi:hypothetical protein
MMITHDAFWRGPDAEDRRVTHAAEYTPQIEASGIATVDACNSLIAEYEAETGRAIDRCNSGWRPRTVNDATAHSGRLSAHIDALAEDVSGFNDVQISIDGGYESSLFARWCATRQDRLQALGLYMEDWHYTPHWCHLTTRAPHSGRVMYMPFDPAENPPPIPLSVMP